MSRFNVFHHTTNITRPNGTSKHFDIAVSADEAAFPDSLPMQERALEIIAEELDKPEVRKRFEENGLQIVVKK